MMGYRYGRLRHPRYPDAGRGKCFIGASSEGEGIPVVTISGSPEAVKFAEDNGLQISAKTFSLAGAL
jgi:hypothetical protein